MVLGLFLLLLSPVLVAVNAFNFRRSLQVREHGLRFVEAGAEREFTWDEIADVAVKCTRVKQMGVVTLRTEWDITIHGHDGRSIHLSPLFLQHVPNVDKLVTTLRLHTRLQ